MIERGDLVPETTKQIEHPGGIRWFLGALGRRLFPKDPVIPQGLSEDPTTEMMGLCDSILGSRNSDHRVLYAKRFVEVSKQLG